MLKRFMKFLKSKFSSKPKRKNDIKQKTPRESGWDNASQIAWEKSGIYGN